MSSKSTYFLTRDNEHAYSDCNCPVIDSNGQRVGNAITIEFSKQNVSVLLDDNEDLVVLIDVDSELYHIMKKALESIRE